MFENNNNRVGQRISNYQLVRLIGCGGFADVYLGEHIYLKTQAAVKILHGRTDTADQPDILNEARTIAQLEHPHIIRLFEFGIDDGYPFLIMSYAARGSLRDAHPKGSRLPAALVVRYVQQAASALDYAHQNRLIHRDVKPENMLIGQNEQLLLTDFGLVMLAQTSRSQASDDLAGTVAYMAPEQLRGRPRFASDQYALGVVVYEWLCGRRPFIGSFGEIASQQMLASPPSLCALEPGLAPKVEQAVFKALAKNPADRFASVGEFAHALSIACASPDMLNFPPGAPVNSQPPDLASSNVDRSVMTLAPRRPDPGETIEIPIDKATILAYDAGTSEQLETVQLSNRKQPGEQILSTAGETITPDPVVQAFQLSPVFDAAQALPLRGNKDLKSMFLLFALLLFIAGSIMMGVSQFGQKHGTSISTKPENTLPLMGTATRDVSVEPSITATGITTDPATPSSMSDPEPIATKPPLIQKVLPIPTLTSVPPTRIPTPAPPIPTPTPIPSTPTPTPEPSPTPTPILDITPIPSITLPTPDANMIPGLIQ